MASSQQQRQQQQPSSGVFKLKIKLNSQPPPPPPQTRPQQQSNSEGDDQEDQLAASSDGVGEEEDDDDPHNQNEDDEEDEGEGEEEESLSEAPPPPPQPKQRATKTKSKPIPSQVLPPNKKRKTQPNASQSITLTNRAANQPLPHHAADPSQGHLPTYPIPKTRATKQPPPATKAKSTRSHVVPLTDAELLSAAGSQYPTHHQSLNQPARSPPPIAHPPPPASSKPPAKKKKSNPDGARKRVAPPPNSSIGAPIPPSNPNPGPPLINQAAPSSQLANKPATATKSKSKKSSKLSQPKTQADPFQPNASGTPPIIRPPPQPRPQHDYTLGPPPPPPVPAFKPLPVGPAPRAQGQFLPAQTLEKRTPKVRSWKKVKRQVIGISGIPFWIWTYAGDDHSDYALAKQNKLTQGIGTPNSTQEGQYMPLVPQSRPASVASSHAKPSPNRAASAASRMNNHKFNSNGIHPDSHPNSSAGSGNLGGPVLPASFRRAPVSLVGSPLGNTSITNN